MANPRDAERRGVASRLSRQKLQFVLGALADFVARELAGDVLQQILAQAALISWPLDEVKSKREDFLRIEAFSFLSASNSG